MLSENDPRDGTAPVRVLSMAIELSGGGARQLLAVQQQAGSKHCRKRHMTRIYPASCLS